MNHSANCKFPGEETFECNRCGAVSLFCCGCGGQDGDSDNAPPLCLTCGEEYYREVEQSRQEELDDDLDQFKAERQVVVAASEKLIAELAARGIDCRVKAESSLSHSHYLETECAIIRVSDHGINPRSGGFWKEDGTPLHAEPTFTLLVSATDEEISSLADKIAKFEKENQ